MGLGGAERNDLSVVWLNSGVLGDPTILDDSVFTDYNDYSICTNITV